jgi:hypothetical protein
MAEGGTPKTFRMMRRRPCAFATAGMLADRAAPRYRDQGQTVLPGEAATVESPLAQIMNVPEVLLEYL